MNAKTIARVAGLVYLVCILAGIFSLMYVPSQINVRGDAAAAIHNIVASEGLFRLGIAVGSVGYIAFLILPLVLYRLLASVDRKAALLMVAFAVVFVPMDFIAIANQLDILSSLNVAESHQVLTVEQLQTRVMPLLDAYHNRILVSEIFWGLWLLPFGYLVFKSGFLPKILGVLLMMGCFGYLITFFGETLFPHHSIPALVMLPASLGEIGICLWFLVVGVRQPASSVG
ncbi:MAG: DUF4386 domain-containing protein [Proteobacteria bacterium]|nr:DUF4386 domain-containing protein [Pseudomonadota bacterium]